MLDVYVSADGADDGDGTKEKPFATVQQAIDLIMSQQGETNV